MKIVFATDHAGFALKEILVLFVRDLLGYELEDMGAQQYDEDDDYPDFVALAARAVADDPHGVKGVVLGGSGQGEAMVANKFKGVRAIVFNGQCFPDGEEYKKESAHEIALSREHNDSNVLALGARFITEDEAKAAVKLWLETPFKDGERHARRLGKITEIEEENFK